MAEDINIAVQAAEATKWVRHLAASIVFLLILLASLSGTALADPAQYVSGPSCTSVNGWCTDHPLLTVKTSGAVCNGYPQPSGQFSLDIAGWSWSGGANNTPPQAQAGRHYVQVLTDSNSDIFLENDGATEAPNPSCGNATGSPGTVVWQGYIQWDETPPSVSIDAPSDNSNVDTSKITVTGKATNDASGVASVTVNSTKASLSGGTYSADISLQTGLNIITVVAKDNAGHQASHSVTVFLREIPAASGGSSHDKSAAQPGTPSTSSNTTTSSSSDVQDKGLNTKTADKASQPTDNLKLVKTVAAGTGVSLVTVLFIVIIMLVLDRLGVIEIKLFDKYHVWRERHYTKRKGAKL